MSIIVKQIQSKGWCLENDEIQIVLDEQGHILSIQNPVVQESYLFHESSFALRTGDETIVPEYCLQAVPEKNSKSGQISLRFIFQYANGQFELVYTLKEGNAFCRRSIIWRNANAERLYSLAFGNLRLSQPAREAVHYLTFWVTPTVEFLRFQKGGLFAGVENPFYDSETSVSGAAMSYAPGLILKPLEGYTSEAQFIGVTSLSGVMIEDSGRRFRYPNASGYIPIDRNESRAMRRFALDYLHPSQDSLRFINYQFFHPLPVMPSNDKDVEYYRHAIDSFFEIGGEHLLISPLHPYTKPDTNKNYWDLWPDDPKAPAHQVMDYVKAKGFKYGFYIGCATHGDQGNSAGLNFRPDHPEWKKTDAAGRRALDNCLACDDFFAWWLHVQDTTIKKYKLSIWCWDPSWGSGMNCYDESHGHIAGMGAYKGWRRCMELSQRLKESNPGLFIQAFYGVKQFGLWGLSAVDGHEVYNEQTAIVATHHTQISDDMQNGDGLRFQNYWSMRFRFLPTVIGHPLIGRASEFNFNPDLVKACDYYGWQYAFFSALAISGTLMPIFLPYNTDLLPGYVDFYKKWIPWAKANWEYVKYTEPFGEQVEAGAIDGYARIHDGHGFIFLFNGNPRASRIRFELGDEIAFDATEGQYEFWELYPSETPTLASSLTGKTIFSPGDYPEFILSANSCRLLEVRLVTDSTQPVLCAPTGNLHVSGKQLIIDDLRGEPGTIVHYHIRHSCPAQIQKLTINGVTVQNWQAAGDGLEFQFAFGGEFHRRELNVWTSTEQPSSLLEIPNAQPTSGPLRVRCTFHLAADVAELLASARTYIADEIDSQLIFWQKSEEYQYSYHNFICERPYRLWLIIPFLHCPSETSAIAFINGKQAELNLDAHGNSWYLDVTELVRYGASNTVELSLPALGEHEFLGPYLLYPQTPSTSLPAEFQPAERYEELEIIYPGQALARLPHNRHDLEHGPKILAASASGPVTLKRPTLLKVKVNLPPEKLRGVYCTQSGFTWMGTEEMQWDAESGCWQWELQPGNRAFIQENEYVYIWAEDLAERHSDFVPIKIEWEFRE